MRARVSANEARAIGETRTVITAEQAYASANCGLFSEVVNLCRLEAGCAGIGIPNPPSAPPFLEGDLGQPSPYSRSGYERDWEGYSVPSLQNITGVRAFRGGSEGGIFVDLGVAKIPCPVDSTVQTLGSWRGATSSPLGEEPDEVASPRQEPSP